MNLKLEKEKQGFLFDWIKSKVLILKLHILTKRQKRGGTSRVYIYTHTY